MPPPLSLGFDMGGAPESFLMRGKVDANTIGIFFCVMCLSSRLWEDERLTQEEKFTNTDR